MKHLIKFFLALLFLSNMALGASLVAHGSGAGVNTFTISGLNTSAANLIVIEVSGFSGVTPTVSSSPANTWTPLTRRTDASSNSAQLFYCSSCAVSASQSFTLTGTGMFASMFVQAWSGGDTSPFDQQNQGAITFTSLQPGSVTPTVDNEIVVTGMVIDATNTLSINSSFTISDQLNNVGGVSKGGGMASIVQGAKAAVNPTWSWSTSANAIAVIATFKTTSPSGVIFKPFP